MKEIIKICKVHGELARIQVRIVDDTGQKKCIQCQKDSDARRNERRRAIRLALKESEGIVKVCNRHGKLTADQVYRAHDAGSYKCRLCIALHTVKYENDKRAANKQSRLADMPGFVPTDNSSMNFNLFMRISNKLIKKDAQHYQLHKKFINNSKFTCTVNGVAI